VHGQPDTGECPPTTGGDARGLGEVRPDRSSPAWWLRVVYAMARVIHVVRRRGRFGAGTVGAAGDRTFYLQASEDVRTISVTIEKQQVEVLTERLGSLLEEVANRFGAEVPEEAPDELVDVDPLDVPVEEEFRVGTMG